MYSGQSGQVSTRRGPKTLRHTSIRDKGIDLRTRFKRDAKLVRGIAPVVDRPGHGAAAVQVAGHAPGVHYDTGVDRVHTVLLNAQRKQAPVRNAHFGKVMPPPQYFVSPSSPQRHALYPSSVVAQTSTTPSQEAYTKMSLMLSPTTTASSPPRRPLPALPTTTLTLAPPSHESDLEMSPTTSHISSSFMQYTTLSTFTSPSSSQPPPNSCSSSKTPPTARSHALEPLELDQITRPTPAETAEVIDTAGLRYICDLPQPTSRIESTVSSLRRFGSWITLRKHGSQISLYLQDCLD